MGDLPDWMARAHVRATTRHTQEPAALTYAQTARPRPMPRQMRGADLRALDPNAGVRRQAERELTMRDAALSDPRIAPRAPVNNQFAEAGAMALEGTGLPAVRRGAANITRGAMNQDPYQGLRQIGGGSLELGLGGLGAAGLGVTPRLTPRPMPAPRAPSLPTRIYRGIVPDEARRSALGDRWWSTDPQVASSYAPAGADGAHVLVGDLDETMTRILNVDAPPGTMFRAIPIESLPPELRQAFPRTTRTVSTHEVAAAAESLGYQGVSFKGIRDSGYGADSRAPGASGGDPGRVLALFDDSLARSPFARSPATGAEPMPRMTPPPREIAPNGMPIRPSEPFRNSLRGGSDDLADAVGMRAAPDVEAQAPALPPNGADPSVRRGIFGPPPRLGVRDMQPEGIFAERRAEPFWDARLSAGENKAVEMHLNGFSNREIADEMDIPPARVSQFLGRARNKGFEIQRQRPGRASDFRGWTAADLYEMRQRGLTAVQIAERTGVPYGSVRARISQEARRRGVPARGNADAAGMRTQESGAIADEAFGANSRRLGSDYGHIIYTPKSYGWRIDESLINRDQRGQGLGVGLYEELIARARAAGAPEVYSDVSTSQGAQNVYAALERRGYRVTREDGQYGPRFRVSTDAPAAPSRTRDASRP